MHLRCQCGINVIRKSINQELKFRINGLKMSSLFSFAFKTDIDFFISTASINYGKGDTNLWCSIVIKLLVAN